MNWLLIITAGIFAVCMLTGYFKGFVKIVVSLAATVLTIILVNIMTPYIAEGIKTFTMVDEVIQEKCMQMLTSQLPDEEKVKNTDLKQLELPRQKQLEILEKSNLPGIFKEGLIENNNVEAYTKLAVSGFAEYVGVYLADMVIKILSFLLSFTIVRIIVRIVIAGANMISALPVLKGFNRIAGMLIGMLLAVIVVWIGFLVITLLYNTAFGKECFVWIRQSEFLTFLYNENIIMQFVTKL